MFASLSTVLHAVPSRRRRAFVVPLLVLAVNGCANGASSAAPQAQTAKLSTPSTNAIHFHLVDFLGWNNKDWDLMREYHTSDVKVVMGSTKTDGIDAHIQGLETMIAKMPTAFITNHRPVVVDGDWNCTVGVVTSMNFSMATVAKFRDGKISEEYLFMKQLKPNDVPAGSGSPVVDIATREEVRRTAGVEAGWRCVMDKGPDGNLFAVLSKAGTETLAFSN